MSLAETVQNVLQDRGWEAKIVSKSSVPKLIPVTSSGLFKCVDGRPSDHSGMDGPKALGGVYAIATNRGVTDLEGLKAIVREGSERIRIHPICSW